MTVCQVCQKENPAGAEYCEDCGAALSTAAPAPVGAGVSSGGSSPARSVDQRLGSQLDSEFGRLGRVVGAG